MKRYAMISIGFGLIAATLTLVPYLLHVFDPLAERLDQFYQARQIYPTDNGGQRLLFVEVTLILLISVWVCWSLSDLNQAAKKWIIGLISFFVVLGISPTLALYGKLVEPFSAIIALVTAGIASVFATNSTLGKRKKTLETLLGHRVSQNTFQQLMDSPEPIPLAGQKKEVSVITCRLFDRADLIDRHKPLDFIQLSNQFRQQLTTYLTASGAYLDDSSPELIRAYYGLIDADKDHATKACKVALGIRGFMKSVNHEIYAQYQETLRIATGIHSGDVITGLYGDKNYYYLSAIGPDIDFSRRLSKANHIYGSDILIGPSTHKHIGALAECRPMEMFFDPETNNLVEIYQLLSMTDQFTEADRSRRDLYWQGLIEYREGNYSKAIETFDQTREPGLEDQPLDYFLTQATNKLAETKGTLSPEAAAKKKLTDEGHSRLLSNL